VGNAIFHFFRQLDLLFTMGVREATAGFTSYLVYCVLLATAIAVSQARKGNAGAAASSASFAERLKSFVCVWGLVVLLHPFGGVEERVYSFHARLSFLVHHVGLS
jgi:hypothetical protein